MKNLPLVLFACSVFVLPSCSAIGVAAGAGASVGIAAAQEGGVSRAVDDARIQIAINDLWFKYSVEAFRKLDLTINQGRVLVTGVVQNPEHRVEAIRLAWQPEGVEQVINEIQVAESQGISGYARDTWITTRLRTAYTFDSEILSINYSIDTVQGTVYLMGFAQNRGELNRAIETARTISGVKGVVSYVKIVSGAQGPAAEAPVTDYSEYSDPADAPPSAVRSQSDFATQAPAVEGGPTVITPQPASVQDGPYIERVNDPVVQENLNARAAQKQRQGIESEVIEWNR